MGRALARGFATAGAAVVVTGRDRPRLDQAVRELSQVSSQVASFPSDVTQADQVQALTEQTLERFGKIDILVNNAGRSARGKLAETSVEEFRALLDVNLLSVVRCTRAALPHLIASRGHVINIGSLAAKAASRYLGAYPTSKFAVAAYSQQLRLEMAPLGVHVLLVCPGPIARDDAGSRYAEQAQGLPQSAHQPGAGVKLKGIPSTVLVAKILRACQRRRPELVSPSRAKLLFAISQLSPSWGDWIISKMTRS